MDLRQLEMFRTVAELESFTRAGEKLHVSHSAISRQIKLLEDELRTLLFTRGTKHVSLTEAGKSLLGFVGPIFEQLRQATESVSQVSQNLVGHLNLGTGTTMLNFFLPPILDKFKRRYPTIPILIKTGTTGHVIEDLRQGMLDLTIASLPLPVEGRDLLVRPLYREELVAVVSPRHPLAGKRSVAAEEIKKFPLIIFSRGSTTRTILDNCFHEVGISPLVQLELENDEAVEKAIAAGIAISFLPKLTASRDRVPFFRIAGHEIFREVGLVRVQSRTLPEHVSYFVDVCCEEAKSMAFPGGTTHSRKKCP
jgi:LysR family cyn operon transcriptional activator